MWGGEALETGEGSRRLRDGVQGEDLWTKGCTGRMGPTREDSLMVLWCSGLLTRGSTNQMKHQEDLHKTPQGFLIHESLACLVPPSWDSAPQASSSLFSSLKLRELIRVVVKDVSHLPSHQNHYNSHSQSEHSESDYSYYSDSYSYSYSYTQYKSQSYSYS